jgi:bifunctional non-homologous end joining protein LigD
VSTLRFGRRAVEVGNEDKVLFADSGITKGELIDYYRRVAPVALPHLRGRPLTLRRFPDGIGAKGFYQQEVSDHFPSWLGRVRLRHGEGKRVEHVVCDDAAGLVYLANQAAIELHSWLSRADAPRSPDRMVFDLDPPRDDAFEEVRAGARAICALLDQVGLVPFLKTTGSRGLHVVVPLRGETDFDAVRDFARDLAERVAARQPERFTLEQRKAARRGRLFLDVLRNAYGQTAVSAYSVRARPGAPVATPIDRDELGDGSLRADRWTLRNLFRRLGQREDPWRGMGRHARSLAAPRRRLDALRATGE